MKTEYGQYGTDWIFENGQPLQLTSKVMDVQEMLLRAIITSSEKLNGFRFELLLLSF